MSDFPSPTIRPPSQREVLANVDHAVLEAAGSLVQAHPDSVAGEPEWARWRSTQTLELAVAASHTNAMDVAHLFDVDWHKQNAENRRLIEDVLEGRRA